MNNILSETMLKELSLKQNNLEYKKIKIEETKDYFKKSEISGSNIEFKELKENKETLGDYIKERFENEFPNWSEDKINANVSILKGEICENFMNEFYGKHWQRIEGEVGRNGIDGLYIKRDLIGNIKDVLLVECKYNTSNLSHTENGKQMSQEWSLKKIDELIAKYPVNKDYQGIKEKLQEGDYRTRVFRLTERGDKLDINIQKVDNSTGEMVLKDVNTNERLKIGNGKLLDMKNPTNNYEIQKAQAYQDIKENTINEKIKSLNKKESQGE